MARDTGAEWIGQPHHEHVARGARPSVPANQFYDPPAGFEYAQPMGARTASGAGPATRLPRVRRGHGLARLALSTEAPVDLWDYSGGLATAGGGDLRHLRPELDVVGAVSARRRPISATRSAG
ncbi:hypothetical protein [Mycolicibacterium doricum]|nr:hypothetical protein [Mycolicibacterium doricum]MCV7268545.1 hypothetical protein [Mycolicibacterium doricum]